MTIALITIGDGRDTIHEQSWASAKANLPRFDQRIIVDDRDHTLGFAGAIQQAWDQVQADWVFHLELDFTFNEPVPVKTIIRLLEANPYLAQISLKRQAVNEREIQFGGIIEPHPDDFTEQHDGFDTWTEDRCYFTTNPSIYSAKLCRLGWPQELYSEGVFTHRLLTDPLLRFGIWGAKYDPPRVQHIGTVRAGHGY